MSIPLTPNRKAEYIFRSPARTGSTLDSALTLVLSTMGVSLDDVRHVAMLAKLGVGDQQVRELSEDLNTILEHMRVLASVETDAIDEPITFGDLRLRPDETETRALGEHLETIATRMEDGLFMVPRLATHEDVQSA